MICLLTFSHYTIKTIILQELRFVWHDSEVHEVIQRLENLSEDLSDNRYYFFISSFRGQGHLEGRP